MNQKQGGQNMKANTIKVAEIFRSIAGECNGHMQGRLTTFIRTSGCNLQCKWKGASCDTPQTQNFNFGDTMFITDIIEKVEHYKLDHICITGGEPLLQKNIGELLRRLWQMGYKISVETNGTIGITPFFRYVESWCVDFKGVDTGYHTDMLLTNYHLLREKDIIKFGISSLREFYEAKKLMQCMNTNAQFAFSPIGDMDAETLTSLLLANEMSDAILNIQIHKYLMMQ